MRFSQRMIPRHFLNWKKAACCSKATMPEDICTGAPVYIVALIQMFQFRYVDPVHLFLVLIPPAIHDDRQHDIQIRHGKPEFPDERKYCIGRTDLPLSEEGRTQIRALGETRLPSD